MLYQYFSIRGVRGSIIPIPHISSSILSGWLKAVAQPFVETARQNGNRHKSAAGWCVFVLHIYFSEWKNWGEKWMVGIFTDNWLNGYYFFIWKYLNKSQSWLINMSNHQAVDHQQFGSYISAAMFEVSLLRFAPRQEPYPKQTCQKLGMVELRFWIPGLFRSF